MGREREKAKMDGETGETEKDGVGGGREGERRGIERDKERERERERERESSACPTNTPCLVCAARDFPNQASVEVLLGDQSWGVHAVRTPPKLETLGTFLATLTSPVEFMCQVRYDVTGRVHVPGSL